MPSLARIEVPAVMLDIDPHRRVVSYIGRRLSQSQIDKSALIFVGIEGEELVDATDTSDLGSDEATFGRSWHELVQDAEVHDRYPGTDNTNPLRFAGQAATQPAMLAYEWEMLKASSTVPDLWIPKIGSTVSDAARAIIFFV